MSRRSRRCFEAVSSTSTEPVAGCVRRAGLGDLDRLLPLWRGLLEHHADCDPAFALDADADGALRRAASVALQDSAWAVFVWDQSGSLGGFCAAHIESSPAGVRERARAEITEIAVEPELRRRAVGRTLAQAALDWAAARGAGRVEVRVAVRNPDGQGFWHALGFGNFVDVLERRL